MHLLVSPEVKHGQMPVSTGETTEHAHVLTSTEQNSEYLKMLCLIGQNLQLSYL